MEYLAPASSPHTALAALAEPFRRWFVERFGEPTPVQRLAWPAVAGGKNLIVSAPTGSGKTLAAFLPIINRLLTEPSAWTLRGLAITPLKALGNDTRKTLRGCLREIQTLAGLEAVRCRVGLRTGDTCARARQALQRRPPDLLLTTPESLAVLLSRPSAQELFAGLRWVVVDEVHALATNKRGADLALSLERLEAIVRAARGRAARLQRIGLSASCTPLATAARFLVGPGRACAVAQVLDERPLHVTIEPLFGEGSALPGGFLARLLERLDREIQRNRTTLVFTNVRSLAERLAWGLRRRYTDWAERIAVHHSALSKARRRDAEHRLKTGRLRVVVSSTSLELGIDIGTVDGVVLVHPPGGVVRLLQRIGRAGHRPGQPCRGLVLAATPAELLEAAVAAASSRAGQWEPLRLPPPPLDVLCQQLLGMAAQQPWPGDAAFALVRQAYPYRDLPRSDFDDCLDYLSGRRSDGRPWLPARIRWIDGEFTIADQRTARILRRNIGTIITEGPRSVRLRRGGTDAEPAATSLVGEVEELFADRLQPGDRFLLDGRCLEYCRRDGAALLVDEVVGRPVAPRWTGEGWPLSRELAGRLYCLRVHAAEALRDGPAVLTRLWHEEYGLPGAAAAALTAHFERQECVSEIPDTVTCLVEVVPCEGGIDYYVHTPLNRAGNDALVRVLLYRLARRRGWPVQALAADLGLALFSRGPNQLTPQDLRALLSAADWDADLAEALAHSDTMRERFRRVAQTGLMLLRHPLGGRRRVGGRDWAERRLYDRVRADDPGCVLLRQAEREVRDECCDSEAAQVFVHDLPRRSVRWRRLAQPSPFAENWTQLALIPAEPIETPEEALERLHATLAVGR
jgi:ATP-dependent Lhr-like helicase